MDAFCLLVAGIVRATLPAPEFTLAWDHSVQKSRWEERYRIEGDSLVLAEARVTGSGAGMEPPPGALLHRGVWSWHPRTRLAELSLTHSGFTADYTICSRHGCSTLSSLVGPMQDGTPVVIRRCS